jgi:hypothetical protein
MRCATGLGLLSALLLVAPTLLRAQPKPAAITLKDGVTVGDAADVSTDFTMAMEVKVKRGEETGPTSSITSRQTQRYREEILARGAKGTTALRRTYSVARESEKNPDGEKNTVSSLQGKTITLKKVGGKTLISVNKGQLQKKDREDVSDDLDSDQMPFFPPHPVVIGEEWTVDPKKLGRLFHDLGKSGKAEAHGRLDELTENDGHPTARVHLTLHVERETAGEPRMVMDLQGDLIHRTDLQRTISVDAAGPLTFKGQANGFDFDGQGTAEMKWRFKPVKLAGKLVK